MFYTSLGRRVFPSTKSRNPLQLTERKDIVTRSIKKWQIGAKLGQTEQNWAKKQAKLGQTRQNWAKKQGKKNRQNWAKNRPKQGKKQAFQGHQISVRGCQIPVWVSQISILACFAQLCLVLPNFAHFGPILSLFAIFKTSFCTFSPVFYQSFSYPRAKSHD